MISTIWQICLGMFGILLVVVLAVLVDIVIGAWRAVKFGPRTDAYLCDVHGPFPASTAFEVGEDLEVSDEQGRTVRSGVKMCPLCFQDKFRQAMGKVK